MITTLFAWTVMFLVIFSIGDIFVSLYNRICRNKESYNLLDTFILGICFISILLPFSSLWFPSNEYVLFAYILVSAIYWYINIKRLLQYIAKIKDTIRSFNLKEKILIIVPVIAVLIYVYIFDHHYDAEYYHYQQIRWNEEFSVVPGLGNLEDRFAFNSNYLLLSAIFTFRFLFGNHEAIYALQSLIYVCFIIWIMVSLIKSKYNILYTISLSLTFLIMFRYGFMFGSSSTDIIPILCIFYYLTKTVLNPSWLKQQPLLACLLPVTMVTFKLSTIALCLISFFILYYLIKKKRDKEMTFIFTCSFLIVALWCIRNIIISGYLIYPIYFLDLFSFNWKMPAGTAQIQSIYIYQWAERMFLDEIYRGINVFKGVIKNIEYVGSFLNLCMAILILFSPFLIGYKYLKKKISKEIIYIYILIIFCITISMFSAPDFRFVYGYMLGIIFLLAYIYTPNSKSDSKPNVNGVFVLVLILTGFYYIAISKFISAGERIGMKFESTIDFIALYHHRSAKNLTAFEEYNMNGITIYTTKERWDNRTFDILPATDPHGIPFEPFNRLKIQDIKTIEARGHDLQDGFRTKKEYIDIINSNAEYYISEYLQHAK